MKNLLSGIANSSKTYSSDIYSIIDYVSFPPRTSFKPWLTIRKPINSQFFHPLSYKFIVLGLLGLYSNYFGFGLQFVTLQYIYLFIYKNDIFVCIKIYLIFSHKKCFPLFVEKIYDIFLLKMLTFVYIKTDLIFSHKKCYLLC